MKKKPSRMTIYFSPEERQFFDEIKQYFENFNDLEKEMSSSSIFVLLVRTFHELFLENAMTEDFGLRMKQLNDIKDDQLEKINGDLSTIKRQLDRMFYLELTNFHAITKGEQFDIQNLESIRSQFDPEQHELMARIEDVIKEDVSRGQTIKHSH
ncbi:hypothetical protein SAMN05660328_101294 [Streptococcus gallolyticus]|uniref:Uncharacterized protein n=1 Tax=Streptococcus gallolyticus TaxID=315405 RepID=A0A1I7FB92_9STRE|nr:hypothetical protein [Streptococcus gallolyticus]SFC04816.1 hypothetical protein SAMN02983012_0442 [Streptococcus gallolyticus]SFU33421.1 hypothetical protein SAMN05660328_101294 [Streptococcus gallolyticus]